MTVVDKILAVVFLILASVVSRLAYKRKNDEKYYSKNVRLNSPPSFRYFYVYLRYSTLVYALAALFWESPLAMVLFQGRMLLYVGIAISSGSLILFSVALSQLGRNYSPCYDSFLPEGVVVSGVYSYVRHPLYVANIAMLFGLFVATGSALIAANCIGLALYYWRAARVEEKSLSREFPTYMRYKELTGGFVPRLRAFRSMGNIGFEELESVSAQGELHSSFHENRDEESGSSVGMDPRV